MSKESKEKLVRDSMPDLCETTPGWSKMTYRIAFPVELYRLLALKLEEETKEVIEAIEAKGRNDIIEEMADLKEVMEALAKMSGITKEEIEKVQISKRLHRGGFSKGVIWDGNK